VALLDLLGLSDLFGPPAGGGLLGSRLVTLLRGFKTHLEHTHCGGGKNSTHRSVSSVDWSWNVHATTGCRCRHAMNRRKQMHQAGVETIANARKPCPTHTNLR
jgi:hypothetical protein